MKSFTDEQLEAYRANKDLRELGPDEVPERYDICFIPNDYYRNLPAYLQKHHSMYKTVAERRATCGVLTASITYFRNTLGTVANPHRAEHFRNGVVPTPASILADYVKRTSFR